MAGTIVSDTLQDGAGNSTATTNAIQGSAKAWVNFVGNNPATVNASYNVSSVTFVSTGYYQINFTNALADAKYVVTGSSSANASTYNNFMPEPAGAAKTTSLVRVYSFYSATPTNVNEVNVSVFR